MKGERSRRGNVQIRKFQKRDTKQVINVVASVLRELFHCKKKDLGQELIDDLSNIKKIILIREDIFWLLNIMERL